MKSRGQMKLEVGLVFLSSLLAQTVSDGVQDWSFLGTAIEKLGTAGILAVIVWVLLMRIEKAMGDMKDALYALRDEVKDFCREIKDRATN
jgi:hypothetical protein